MGFIKVSRHYQSCILQIYARGIPIGNNASIELYAFYCDDGNVYGAQIGTLNSHGPQHIDPAFCLRNPFSTEPLSDAD